MSFSEIQKSFKAFAALISAFSYNNFDAVANPLVEMSSFFYSSYPEDLKARLIKKCPQAAGALQ